MVLNNSPGVVTDPHCSLTHDFQYLWLHLEELLLIHDIISHLDLLTVLLHALCFIDLIFSFSFVTSCPVIHETSFSNLQTRVGAVC